MEIHFANIKHLPQWLAWRLSYTVLYSKVFSYRKSSLALDMSGKLAPLATAPFCILVGAQISISELTGNRKPWKNWHLHALTFHLNDNNRCKRSLPKLNKFRNKIGRFIVHQVTSVKFLGERDKIFHSHLHSCFNSHINITWYSWNVPQSNFQMQKQNITFRGQIWVCFLKKIT